ncbi:MAG: ferritin-like domain-containing protein [Phycisphaera sp.]|nr:MAG: ferritin-like domain-containing protein [Phycisphaera sp.]
MKIDSLEKLYVHELKDLHSAESQILDALPKMISAASDDELKKALESHRKETQEHLARIERLFQNLDFEPGGHKCKGIEGLIKEGEDVLAETEDDAVRNAAIVAACQRVEHYEMAAYGVARAFASKLGRHDDAEVLTTTLEEEGHADRTLTQIAEQRLNFAVRTA